MNTLDRYIARQYLFNVVALLVLLFSFVVAVDVSLNLDKFIDASRKLDPNADSVRRGVLVALGVLDLWWPKLLQLFNYLVGLVLVAAMGFTFTQLVRHRELVAVLAGGVSLHRVARPVLVVAACVMGLRWINSELVLSSPRIAPLLTREPADMGRRSWSEFRVNLVPDSSNRIFMAESFDPGAGAMEGVTIWERDKSGHAKLSIHAERAVWDKDAWVLTAPRADTMTLSEGGVPSEQVHVEAPERIKTDLGPEALKLKRYEAFSQTLSWGQISELVRTARPEMHDKLQRIRWSRVSQILSSMLSLIIAMPFFLVREPKNMIVQSLKCAPVGIISLVGGILLSSVAWPALPPGFGVFIPVIILIPIAIASVSMVRT